MSFFPLTDRLPLDQQWAPVYKHNSWDKLQALDYDILPPAIALTGYIIGPLILSANGQFFIGAHMAVRL